MSFTSSTPAASNGFVDVRDFGADPSGLTDSRAAIQAAIDHAQSLTHDEQYPGPGAIVIIPPGRYLLVSPTSGPCLAVTRAVQILSTGGVIVTRGNADVLLIEGNPASFSSVKRLTIYAEEATSGGSSRNGIVVHAFFVSVEDVCVDGKKGAGVLIESGYAGDMEGSTLITDPAQWVGSDQWTCTRVYAWNCGTNIRAHGSDSNCGMVVGAYSQSTGCCVDENTLSGACLIGVYAENGPVPSEAVSILARPSGETVMVKCGSDGPKASLHTRGCVVVGRGLGTDDPHVLVSGAGCQGLAEQVWRGDAPSLQAGLGDAGSGAQCWFRGSDEPAVTGWRRSDDYRSANIPRGWWALSYGNGPGAVAMYVSTDRADPLFPNLDGTEGERGAGRTWFPRGIRIGAGPLESTMAIYPTSTPPKFAGVEGDWCPCTVRRVFTNDKGQTVRVLGWSCVKSGSMNDAVWDEVRVVTG